MVADAVESASRTLSEPTPGRIEGLVGELIEKRLHDGQFDECGLTLREIAEIRESLDQVAHRHLSRPRQVSRAAHRLRRRPLRGAAQQRGRNSRPTSGPESRTPTDPRIDRSVEVSDTQRTWPLDPDGLADLARRVLGGGSTGPRSRSPWSTTRRSTRSTAGTSATTGRPT